MRPQEDLDAAFQLPTYLEELLHELDVSQPLLRAEVLTFKVEAQEEGEMDFRQENLVDGDGKEPNNPDDSEAVAAGATAAAAARAAKLAEFADKTIFGKRKKQHLRKAAFQGPVLEPQILWKPDANGGRPVPKREDLKGLLANPERVDSRPATVPTPRLPRRRVTRKRHTARALLESPNSMPTRPSSRPQTSGLPGLEVLGLEVGNANCSVYGELGPPRPLSARSRPSTAERTPRIVECPMLVKAVSARSPQVRQLIRPGSRGAEAAEAPGQAPWAEASMASGSGPIITTESLPSVSPTEEDFDRQISPPPGFQFGSAGRHKILLPQQTGSPTGNFSPRSPLSVLDCSTEAREGPASPRQSIRAEGAESPKMSIGALEEGRAGLQVQLPRLGLQHQGSMATEQSSPSMLRAGQGDFSQDFCSQGSQGTLGRELPSEESLLLAPLPSTESFRHLLPPADDVESKGSIGRGTANSPDLDRDSSREEKEEEEKAEDEEAEIASLLSRGLGHQRPSQLLAPPWAEANQSYHSMIDGPHEGSVQEELGAQDSYFMEPEAAPQSEEVRYLVPPWALREHLQLDSDCKERHLSRDDTPMDPEVCAILKGLEKAPALVNSRPSSRASPSRPCSASCLGASDVSSLMTAVYTPRGIHTVHGHRNRRHLVTPSPTLSNPESPPRARTQTPTRPEGNPRPIYAALGTTMLCLMHPSRSAAKVQIASQCMAMLNAGRLHGRRRPRNRAGTAMSTTQQEPEPERAATPESWQHSAGSCDEDSLSPRSLSTHGGRVDLAQPSFGEEIFH